MSLNEVAGGLVRSLLWFAVIFALVALVVQIAKKFRGASQEAEAFDSSEAMTNFRDLHARGGLSDEEYQHIKKKLASEVRSSLNKEA